MRVVVVPSFASSVSVASSSSVPARARAGRERAMGRDGRRGASTRARALPPANEIAGFVVGAALVGLCFGGATLDGMIARAQAAGMEGEDARRGTKAAATTTRRGKGSGNVFVVPDDDESGDGGGGGGGA